MNGNFFGPLAKTRRTAFRTRVAGLPGVPSDIPGAVQNGDPPAPRQTRRSGCPADAGKFHGGDLRESRGLIIASPRRDVPVSDADIPFAVESQIRHGRLFRDWTSSFGTKDDLRRLVDGVHARRIIPECVFNHRGYWWTNFRSLYQKRRSVAVPQLVLYPQLSRGCRAAELRLRRALQNGCQLNPVIRTLGIISPGCTGCRNSISTAGGWMWRTNCRPHSWRHSPRRCADGNPTASCWARHGATQGGS